MTTKAKNKTPSRSNGQKKSSGGNPILLIVFAVVAIALIAAIVLSSDKPAESGGEYGTPEITRCVAAGIRTTGPLPPTTRPSA